MTDRALMRDRPLRLFRLFAFASTLAALLAACGGGGGGSSSAGSVTLPGMAPGPAGGSGATASPQGTGTLSFGILIPIGGSVTAALRKPKFVSPSTASLTVALQGQSALLGTVNLSVTAPACTTGVNGLTCTVSVSAPAGNDMFNIATYDGQNGTGHQLSVATVAATVVANSTNTLAVALSGVPSTVTVIAGSSSLPVGVPGAVSVVAQAYDADGNAIVGPGTFANPITLTITGDTWGTLVLNPSLISSPGQVATLAYNGNSLAGATITPSGTGLTGTTAATFAASGISVSEYQPSYETSNGENYLYAYGVAALPNGNAAALFYGEIYPTTGSNLNQYMLGIVNTTGVQTLYAGDTADPYNIPAPGGLVASGVTVVNGMSNNIEYDEGESYQLVATDSVGKVYYTASFTSPSDPLCVGGTASSGLIGILNPAGSSVQQIPLKGYPYQFRVDANNNIWFTEATGNCTLSGNFLPSTYAVGEISSSGAITEVPYSTLGLPNDEPYDMNITPDGTTMVIADESGNAVIKIATSGWSATSINPNFAKYPYTVAVAPDGTVAWFSDEDPEDQYYWGFTRGSAAFSAANAVEQTFPELYFFSYSMVYGDGSFWVGSEEYNTGIGRLANVANVTSGTPVTSVIPLPYPDEEGSEIYGVSFGYGYLWGWDDEYERIVSLQYGAAKAGIVNSSAIHYKHAPAAIRLPKLPQSTVKHHTSVRAI